MADPRADEWTLITVTYNSRRQLDACWGRASIGKARWVVVDNASDDDSVAVAQELGAEVIRLSRNIGFAAANNVGLASVSSRWVAFVNPDVTVADPADLQRLARVAALNDGLVAPQLLNPDGTEQPNARGLPYPVDKMANRLGWFPGSRLNEYVRSGITQPTYCAWLMGAAIAGATALVRELGGWDERYFVYYEDHDFGLRSWKAGHPVVLDPQVRWIHKWQRATTRPRLVPWMNEMRAGRNFFRKYPEIVSRRRFRALEQGALGSLKSSLWREASNPGSNDGH